MEDLHTEAQEGLKILQQEGQTHHNKYENMVVHTVDTYWHVFVFYIQNIYKTQLTTHCSIVHYSIRLNKRIGVYGVFLENIKDCLLVVIFLYECH